MRGKVPEMPKFGERDHTNQEEGNPLYKQKLNEHPHKNVVFILNGNQSLKDLLTRLANEAVRINTSTKM